MTREEILKADDAKYAVVNVPEWGGPVRLRTMSGTDRDSFEQTIVAAREAGATPLVRASLLVRCICDDTGARLFSDADGPTLGKKSAAVLSRLFDAASKLNAIGSAVDDLEKNSDSDPNADSISA